MSEHDAAAILSALAVLSSEKLAKLMFLVLELGSHVGDRSRSEGNVCGWLCVWYTLMFAERLGRCGFNEIVCLGRDNGVVELIRRSGGRDCNERIAPHHFETLCTNLGIRVLTFDGDVVQSYGDEQCKVTAPLVLFNGHYQLLIGHAIRSGIGISAIIVGDPEYKKMVQSVKDNALATLRAIFDRDVDPKAAAEAYVERKFGRAGVDPAPIVEESAEQLAWKLTDLAVAGGTSVDAILAKGSNAEAIFIGLLENDNPRIEYKASTVSAAVSLLHEQARMQAKAKDNHEALQRHLRSGSYSSCVSGHWVLTQWE